MHTTYEKNNNQDRRITKTKRSIREALLSLLNDKELSKITIKELAATADINRKTFYAHYQSVDDIIDEIEDELVDNLDHTIRNFDVFQDKRNFLGLFQNLNVEIADHLDLYQKLTKIDKATDLSNKIKARLNVSVLPDVSHQFNLDSSNASIVVNYMISGLISVYVDWFYSNQSMPLEKVADIVGALSVGSLTAASEMLQTE